MRTRIPARQVRHRSVPFGLVATLLVLAVMVACSPPQSTDSASTPSPQTQKPTTAENPEPIYQRLARGLEQGGDLDDAVEAARVLEDLNQLDYKDTRALRLLAYTQRNLQRIEESEDPDEQLALYRELESISPGGYSEEIDRLEASKGAAPKNLGSDNPFNQQFDAQGQHRLLTARVKQSLFDPSSFKHLETEAFEKGNYLHVKMRYRSRDRVGAYSTKTAEAFYDTEGTYIEPRSGLTFLEVRNRSTKYRYTVTGRVRNDGDLPLERLKIGVDFLGAAGNVIDSGMTTVIYPSKPLLPGSARKFEVSVDADRRIINTRYYLVEEE